MAALPQVGTRPAGHRQFGDPNSSDAVAKDPRIMRTQGEWHIWGCDWQHFAEAGALMPLANVACSAAAGGKNSMCAIAGYFPEAVTITKLGLGLAGDSGGGGGTGVPVGGEHGWLGIAPDIMSGTDHYPGTTIVGSGARVVGLGTGVARIRGANVAVRISAGSIMWVVYQNQITGVAGGQYGGINYSFGWSNWGGVNDLSGKDFGGTFLLPQGWGGTWFGWCTPVANTLAYTFEQSFPAGGRRLRNANDADANNNQLFSQGNGGLIAVLYQFTR